MHENHLPSATDSVNPSLQFQPHLPRILVVDHDPYTCHLNAELLIQQGFEVNAVEDGAAGWEELQAYPYNLLITDLDLPKITGVKLVRKLRDAHLDLPVVMVAKKLPTRELARNPSLQVAATLLKPLAVGALLSTVKNVLRAAISSGGQVASQVLKPALRGQSAPQADTLRKADVLRQARAFRQADAFRQASAFSLMLQEIRKYYGGHSCSGINE